MDQSLLPTCPHCGDTALWLNETENRMECDACGKPLEETTAPKEFHIDTEERANWLLRKLANLDAEHSRVKAQADALLRQIDSDKESLLHLYGGELEQFVRERLAANGNRRKSVHFLQGTCQFRTIPARLQIEEEGAIPADSGFHETRQVLNRAAYLDFARKHWETEGDLLPGLAIVPAQEAFTIRSGKAGE